MVGQQRKNSKKNSEENTHEFFMCRALQLAYSRLGEVSPNPSVGAVVVRDGKIISEGVTQKPGGNHAEAEALGKIIDVRGATLYVTLEPCCHTAKKTSPCTERIIASGVAKVVIGCLDENPAVCGKGIEALRSAGIEVVLGVLGKEARAMYEFFFSLVTKKIPFVTVKAALTLDGKMSWGDGKRKQVTGVEAQRKAHEMRRVHDAVLVGVNTVIHDDPQLTCRLVEGRNPLRVVLDSQFGIPLDARVFGEEGKTLVFCTALNDKEKREKITKIKEKADVAVVSGRDGRVDLSEVLVELGKRGVTSVLVEGGASVIASFLNEKKADKIAFFFAPFEQPSGKGFFELLDGKALMPRNISASVYGKDILVEGYV